MNFGCPRAIWPENLLFWAACLILGFLVGPLFRIISGNARAARQFWAISGNGPVQAISGNSKQFQAISGKLGLFFGDVGEPKAENKKF